MLNSPYFALLFVVFYTFLTRVNSQLQCRDEKNQPVDWFVIYKIPKISESSNPLIKTGVAYAYITSNNTSDGWKVSEISVASKTSIPGLTLAPLYTKNNSILWTIYNDQAPNTTYSGRHGHTKGVVMADEWQGFWLVHSVPRYPPPPEHGTDPLKIARRNESVKSMFKSDDEYNYPKSGKPNGQSFLCISVNKDQFDLIGRQLMYNEIMSYKNNLPEMLVQRYPNLNKAANKIYINDRPYNHKASFQSLGGIEFLSFAKTSQWGKDLYDDFVAPQLGSDLFTETWPNGPGRLSSHCVGSKVINIKSINLAQANVVFTTTHDHSKWTVAVSGKKNTNWVCIGDINRAKAQLERGGGTVCLNLEDVWRSYRLIVNDVEACPKGFFNWITNLFFKKA